MKKYFFKQAKKGKGQSGNAAFRTPSRFISRKCQTKRKMLQGK